MCLYIRIATEDVVQRKLLWEAVEGRGYKSVMLEMNSVSEDSITKEKKSSAQEGENFHLSVDSSQQITRNQEKKQNYGFTKDFF